MVGLYWIVGLLYTSIDITKRPKWFLRYKIQPISQVNKASLRKLIKQVIINQIWGAVIGFFLIQFRNRYFEPSKHVPTISGFLFEWIICSLIREALFYYSHRLLHHPSIYKYIHKRHHEWQTPVALVAIYSHPIEHAISNVIPVMAGRCISLFWIRFKLYKHLRSNAVAVASSSWLSLDVLRDSAHFERSLWLSLSILFPTNLPRLSPSQVIYQLILKNIRNAFRVCK